MNILDHELFLQMLSAVGLSKKSPKIIYLKNKNPDVFLHTTVSPTVITGVYFTTHCVQYFYKQLRPGIKYRHDTFSVMIKQLTVLMQR